MSTAPSMQGKSVLVTGGTAGIGRAAAAALAARGASVIVHGLDARKAETAAAEIRRASGSAAVAPLAFDLASFSEVRRAAAALLAGQQRLDVLICNAGRFLAARELTPEGHEKTFAAIHLGHFLLTQILLGSIKAAPQGRIIFVSCPPGSAKVHFDDLSLAQGYSTMKAQYHAKGAMLMFARELARRLAGSAVTSNSMLPGYMIKTDLLVQMPLPMRLAVKWFGITPEQGAEPQAWLACAPELAGVSGRHFHRFGEKTVRGQAADAQACGRLWDLSMKLTGLAP